MASTYTPIPTTTLGSSSSSITFSSISGTYTDLRLVIKATASASVQCKITVNNDTASNYSVTGMSGNGTTAESFRGLNRFHIIPDYYYSITTTDGMVLVDFMNYSNTTTYKTVLSRAGNAGQATMANVNLWRSTAAINRVDIAPDTGTFSAGSTFTLYGVKSA